MEGGGRHAGVTLASVLGKEKDMSLRVNRTLLDIIRQEEPNCRVYENIINSQNRKGWKVFKEKRRSNGDVWAERVPVTLSDVALREEMVSSSNAMAMGVGCESNQRLPLAQLLRAQSARVVEQLPEEDDSGDVPWAATGEVQSLNQYLSRENELEQENSLHIEHVLGSVAIAPTVNRSSSMLTPNTSHIPSAGQPDMSVSSVRLSEALAAERQHMQTVISSTEAPRSARNETETDVFETNNHSEERVQIDAEVANEQPQVRMSLMDLLEETDNRQLGGSSYSMGVYDHTGIIDEGNDYVEEEGSNFVDRNCCVCMVRHKGSAFIPCGHTFCRLCSRELWVKRGNCPICNGFILEILDIF